LPVIQSFSFTFESLTGRPRERSALSLQLQLVRDGFTQSNRKNEKEKMRRGKLGYRDRADKVAMIGANVLTILEINGK